VNGDGLVNVLDCQGAGAGNFWSLMGNAGTTPGTNFLGTTDNQALELRVNGRRALLIQPTADAISPNLIGGFNGNGVVVGVYGATVGGGGQQNLPNLVNAIFGTVGGGVGNTASGQAATVGGGGSNTASGLASTVGGGEINAASGIGSTVDGGASNTASGLRSTVGGGINNTASGVNATVGGGGNNQANADFATIAGGGPSNPLTPSTTNNVVTDNYGTIGGGGGNQAGNNAGPATDATFATVGGGANNTASGREATVGGGQSNTASGQYATVGGGFFNIASGFNATIPGGSGNRAAGAYSFAAGNVARANHIGAFVWGDSSPTFIASTAANQFIVRASGGLWFGTNSFPSIPAGQFISTSTGAFLSSGGVWTNASDAALKENFTAIDPLAILQGVVDMPITRWNYIAEGDTLHIGPTAQDFYAAFGVGQDDVTIGTIDADGVALAAIQGLYQLVEQKDTEIAALQQDNDDLRGQLEDIEARLTALEQGSAVNSASSLPMSPALLPWLLAGGFMVWFGRRSRSKP
jgi:hypothetical protein